MQGGEAAMGDEDDELNPHCTYVLVAKTLTKSDTAGRVILPRVSVESNLSFLMGYRCIASPSCRTESCSVCTLCLDLELEWPRAGRCFWSPRVGWCVGRTHCL